MRQLYETGFGYLTVLFVVMVMSLVMGAAAENIETALKREKEKEWLFIGKQYQQAISSFYHQSPNGFKVLPTSLSLLVKDTRFIKHQHHLRKAFLDPMTMQPWQLILNNQNKIIGVRSHSNAIIQMSHQQLSSLLGTDIDDNINRYSDLTFEYQPGLNNQNQNQNQNQTQTPFMPPINTLSP